MHCSLCHSFEIAGLLCEPYSLARDLLCLFPLHALEENVATRQVCRSEELRVQRLCTLKELHSFRGCFHCFFEICRIFPVGHHLCQGKVHGTHTTCIVCLFEVF